MSSEDDHAPAQSAIYHLALALVRSGALAPAELADAAARVDREGNQADPDSGIWWGYAHALRLAAIDIEDAMNKPTLGVIDGGRED